MKVYLGKVRDNAGTYSDGEDLYLEKHKWDCGWYWAFGYIGNENCHFHFDSILDHVKTARELFSETNISDKEWWVIRDLFKQAYSLKSAAETYRHGGYESSQTEITHIIVDDNMCTRLNSDLKKILDKVWDFTVEATSK